MIKATDLVERKVSESYLTLEHIEIIRNIFIKYKEIEGRSTIINVKDISEDKYSISPKLYVKSAEGEPNDDDIQENINFWNLTSHKSNEELISLINILN